MSSPKEMMTTNGSLKPSSVVISGASSAIELGLYRSNPNGPETQVESSEPITATTAITEPSISEPNSNKSTASILSSQVASQTSLLNYTTSTLSWKESISAIGPTKGRVAPKTGLPTQSSFVTQEALSFKDSSGAMAKVVASLILDDGYHDLFSKGLVEALNTHADGLQGYLNEVSQQATSDKYYVEAVDSKRGHPFLLTGARDYRTDNNCYILRTTDNAGETFSERVQKLLTTLGGQVKYKYESGVSGFAVCFPESQLPLTLLKSVEGFHWIEREQYVECNQVQESAPWQLARLNTPMEPLSQNMRYTFPATGNGVNVYIIDSGALLDHPEFSGRATIGYSVFTEAPQDCAGHGTQVSSVIGGVNVGVAKRANLILLQVLDCDGQGENSAVLLALDWVVRNHAKPAVVNMSVGGPKSQAVDEAVQAAIDAGIAVVVAAGNSQVDACTNSPSGVESAMVVGASTYDLKRAAFSNWGTCVEIFAPGSHVVAAAIDSQATTMVEGRYGYTFVSGTSLSAPIVTGVYALLLESNPNSTPKELKAAMLKSAEAGLLDASTLQNSPNLLVTMPQIKDMGPVSLDFLPPGALPYLLPPSSSSTVELILIIVAICLASVFAAIMGVFLYRRRKKSRASNSSKLVSAFQ